MNIYDYLPGARSCVRIAELINEDHVLIITDRPALADVISMAIKENKIKCEIGIIYLAESLRPVKKLPDCLKKIILASDVVFTIIGDRVEEGIFRKAIVQLSDENEGRKIFHMVSAKEDMFTANGALALSEDEFNKMVELTEKLALILTMAQEVKIESAIHEETNLEIDLGGSKKPAIISTGKVLKGSWGNLPSGEAFILPGRVKDGGKIVIDGAISYMNPIINPVTLEVLNNKVSVVGPSSKNSNGQEFKNLLEKISNEAKKNGENPDNLVQVCEFGIGTNPKARLTEIIEIEKIRGTIHIAIGDNVFFGGTITAPNHIDMVIIRPIVTIDNKYRIIDGGFVRDDTIKNYFSISYRSFSDELPPKCKIKIKDDGSVIPYENHLRKCWRDHRGNEFFCQIGDDETSSMAKDFSDFLEGKEKELKKIFSKWSKYDRSITCKLINLLKRYDAIEIGSSKTWG